MRGTLNFAMASLLPASSGEGAVEGDEERSQLLLDEQEALEAIYGEELTVITSETGCGCASTHGGAGGALAVMVLAAAALRRR